MQRLSAVAAFRELPAQNIVVYSMMGGLIASAAEQTGFVLLEHRHPGTASEMADVREE
jgi:hypothetical protein